ncbi:unnamed protein product [Rhizophagus irregularis]|uniref:Uncharacterized protein n=1 Tax=Rhizophagus irregularis TaxID=588596 RepID=A0A915ZH67_9GLOM|nr:unnamed protein product [Rhizophagus irregularis]CAB5211858.1 unnamed protein product [Rhizophagus irregularis]CAB5376077.1 unnamed protein product [Rhizophagus irregularis]
MTRRRNSNRSARPINLTDESTSRRSTRRVSRSQSTDRVMNNTRRITRTERRNQLVQLFIQDLNTEQGENFIGLQDRMEVRHNDILQRIRDLCIDYFSFGEAIKDMYMALLSENGNDHNARVALNREIEALFPSASSRGVLRKISRARNVYVTAELRRRSGCQLTSCLNGFPAWSYHDRVNQNVPDIGLL